MVSLTKLGTHDGIRWFDDTLRIWDQGSGKKLIPDPGSGGKKSTESRISIHNTKFLYHKWLLKIYIRGMSRSQKLYCEEMQKLWKQNIILLIARGDWPDFSQANACLVIDDVIHRVFGHLLSKGKKGNKTAHYFRSRLRVIKSHITQFTQRCKWRPTYASLFQHTVHIFVTVPESFGTQIEKNSFTKILTIKNVDLFSRVWML